MKRRVWVGAASALFATVAGASNGGFDERPYITAGPHYVFEDSARGTEYGVGGAVTLGQRFNRWVGLEGGVFASLYRRSRPTAWNEGGVFFDVNLFLTDSATFSPYLLGGAGYMRSEARGSVLTRNYEKPFAHVGAGFQITPADWSLGVKADYRYRVWDTRELDSNGRSVEFGDHIVSLGLVVPIGAKVVEVVRYEEKPLVDSDGDGVPDHLDQCPNTPAGVRVDARGCPLDSDGDGVPDYLDKCPDTKRGVKVDQHGCPVDVLGPDRVFENVYFGFDRSDLTAQAQAVLDAAVPVILKLANEYPRLIVQLDGHTDSIGSPGYNQALSERRAASVKQYLIRKGVDARRIQTRAFGLTKPIASNDTEEGRALNRRVEIRTRDN